MFYVLCMVKNILIYIFFMLANIYIYLPMYYHIICSRVLRWKTGKFLVEKWLYILYVHRSMIYENNIAKSMRAIKVLKRMLISKVISFLLIRQMWTYFFLFRIWNECWSSFMLCVCVCVMLHITLQNYKF